jgi:3D (Asp-Asp-Asp) domain-containing protein
LRRHGQLAALAAALSVLFSTSAAQADEPKVDPIGDIIKQAVEVSAEAAMKLTATLYHGGAPGIRGLDSLGCAVSPMRTLAVDPKVIPKRSIVFIEETVGMVMPNGKPHDGLWYASDVGGAIKGQKIDLFTGSGKGSMSPFMDRRLNLAKLTAHRVGAFKGCPPKD